MRSRWFGYGAVAVALVVSLVGYDQMPPRVATHWNVHGEPDGFSARLVAVLALPLLMLAIRGILAILPAIDPRGENYARFATTYWLIVNGVLSFMLLIHLVIVVNGIGYPVRVDRMALGGLGLLLALIGNYLGRLAPNWFIGIRTPWTLSSDTVWRRTHRVGGWIFVLGGLGIVASVFLPFAAMPFVVVTLALVAVVPVVLSYLLWKRERNART